MTLQTLVGHFRCFSVTVHRLVVLILLVIGLPYYSSVHGDEEVVEERREAKGDEAGS